MFGRRNTSVVTEAPERPATAGEAVETAQGRDASHGHEGARALLQPIIAQRLDEATVKGMSRGDVARAVKQIVGEVEARGALSLNRLEARDMVTHFTNALVEAARPAPPPPQPPPPPSVLPDPPDAGAPDAARQDDERPPDGGPLSLAIQSAVMDQAGASPRPEQPEPAPPTPAPAPRASYVESELLAPQVTTQQKGPAPVRSTVEEAKHKVQPYLIDRIDIGAASQLPRSELARQIGEIVVEITNEQRMRLNLAEQRDLVTMLINDMLGLGPLEPLLDDESVTDIMVNGPYQVYIERKGKLELTEVRFNDNPHVMNIAQRIVTQVGRRIDESQPLVDARLPDGSRVNIIAPPLAIDGAAISIRKFSKKSITLDIMARQANISPQMATVLKIASRCELNTLISGGTGSGKTTLLNAMSQMIDHGERIVTIEDAAELQLQQPHVVRLETRPPNLEGHGEITMRDLVKNALRMRPDRIILGEVRGGEALDMLQAMNTGHEGSMSTIHANRPREALTRLENMVGMAGVNLPSKAVRQQIASAINLIVQVSRMRDGMRRVTSITEVMGMEGDVIITQELFRYDFEGEESGGKLRGSFQSGGLRPHFTPKAEYYGLDRALLEAI